MLCILTIIAIVFIANNAVNSSECRTIKQGAHYPTKAPFPSYKSGEVISTRVQFTHSSASYSFPSTDPDRIKCSVSWNKLWGACRCGYFTSNHQDSDRFVFRRAQSCLVYEPENVIREINNCSESYLIEIAAYAYDNGEIPWENEGRLLKEFSTRLQVDIWYTMTIIFEETKTIYQLFDNNNQLLETKEIDHRQCKSFNIGGMQDIYFGGQCPAPQDVIVCFEKV